MLRRPLFAALIAVALTAPAAAFGPDEVYESANPFFDAAKMIEAGEYAAAYDWLAAATFEEEHRADHQNLLGFTARKSGDIAAAARHYREALRIEPDHLDALEYQGQLFLMLGDVPSAEANLARLIALCGHRCPQTSQLLRAIESGSTY